MEWGSPLTTAAWTNRCCLAWAANFFNSARNFEELMRAQNIGSETDHRERRLKMRVLCWSASTYRDILTMAIYHLLESITVAGISPSAIRLYCQLPGGQHQAVPGTWDHSINYPRWVDEEKDRGWMVLLYLNIFIHVSCAAFPSPAPLAVNSFPHCILPQRMRPSSDFYSTSTKPSPSLQLINEQFL